jgi:Protein of unknown function (DUF4235)
MAKLLPGKGGNKNQKLAAALATSAAVWLVRKLLAFGWQRATGKTPPDPTDPKVSVVEALGWAVIAGVGVEATKLATARLTSRRLPEAADGAVDAAES